LTELVDEEDETRYLAKARTPLGSKFPTEIWNPTVSKLMEHWLAE
jgi:hypothetical protein